MCHSAPFGVLHRALFVAPCEAGEPPFTRSGHALIEGEVIRTAFRQQCDLLVDAARGEEVVRGQEACAYGFALICATLELLTSKSGRESKSQSGPPNCPKCPRTAILVTVSLRQGRREHRHSVITTSCAQISKLANLEGSPRPPRLVRAR